MSVEISLPAFLYSCSNALITGQIFMKFDGEFYEQL